MDKIETWQERWSYFFELLTISDRKKAVLSSGQILKLHFDGNWIIKENK